MPGSLGRDEGPMWGTGAVATPGGVTAVMVCGKLGDTQALPLGPPSSCPVPLGPPPRVVAGVTLGPP